MGLLSIVHIPAKITMSVKEYKNNNLYEGQEIKIAFCEVIVSLWIIIYVSCSMILTTGLLIYHIKIIKDNKTTREELKELFINPFKNPFQRTTKENFFNNIFPNIGKKSLLDKLKENKNDYNKFINKLNKKLEDEKKETKNNLDEKNGKDNVSNITNEEEKLIREKQKKNMKESLMKSIDKSVIKIKFKNDEEHIIDKMTDIGENIYTNDLNDDKMSQKKIIPKKNDETSEADTDVKEKNFNINNVNILESQSYLPSATNKDNLETEAQNNKVALKRISKNKKIK